MAKLRPRRQTQTPEQLNIPTADELIQEIKEGNITEALCDAVRETIESWNRNDHKNYIKSWEFTSSLFDALSQVSTEFSEDQLPAITHLKALLLWGFLVSASYLEMKEIYRKFKIAKEVKDFTGPINSLVEDIEKTELFDGMLEDFKIFFNILIHNKKALQDNLSGAAFKALQDLLQNILGKFSCDNQKDLEALKRKFEEKEVVPVPVIGQKQSSPSQAAVEPEVQVDSDSERDPSPVPPPPPPPRVSLFFQPSVPHQPPPPRPADPDHASIAKKKRKAPVGEPAKVEKVSAALSENKRLKADIKCQRERLRRIIRQYRTYSYEEAQPYLSSHEEILSEIIRSKGLACFLGVIIGLASSPFMFHLSKADNGKESDLPTVSEPERYNSYRIFCFFLEQMRILATSTIADTILPSEIKNQLYAMVERSKRMLTIKDGSERGPEGTAACETLHSLVREGAFLARPRDPEDLKDPKREGLRRNFGSIMEWVATFNVQPKENPSAQPLVSVTAPLLRPQ